MSVIEADLPVQTPQLSWQKKLAYLAIIWVVVLGALACFGEVMLRVLPLGRFRSLPFRRYDPNIGLALIPNRKVSHNRGCFSGVVETNSFGWRDRERTLEKPSGTFRIAMLGDSYVEAVHVKPEEVVNIQLEKLLREQGYNAEVLNFGIEGIGSTQELLVYEQKARQFHPDVVLMMYTWNDIMNNSSVIQPEVYGIHTWYAPYYDLGPDGNLVLRPVQRRWFNDTQTWLEEHSVLVYYLERIWQRVNYAPAKWEGVSVYWGVYGDPPDAEWSKAWEVTEKVMVLSNKTVTADGAKFMVVAVPDFWEIDPDWRQRLTKQIGTVPANFDPPKARQRFEDIFRRNNIPYAAMTPELTVYRDQHHLQWPYFSFTCDTHASAMGHAVSAQVIYHQLEQHGMLPPQPNGTPPAALP